MSTPRASASALTPLVLASLAAVYLIWSSTYLAIRYAVESLPPLLSSGARYVVAGSVLYAGLRARRVAAPTGRQWMLSLPVGGLMFLGGNGLVVLAEQRVSSGLAAVACAAMPLFACAISHLFGERPSRREWAGVALGFGGVVLLTVGELRAARADGAFLLLAPAGWALGTVLARRVGVPKGAMSSATLMIAGGLLTMAVALARGEQLPADVPLRGALALAYLAVFGSLVGFSAYTYLLRHTTTALATSYAYVNPVLAVLLGAAVGGEKPGAGLIVPGALVVAGVAVMATGKQGGRGEARGRGGRGETNTKPQRDGDGRGLAGSGEGGVRCRRANMAGVRLKRLRIDRYRNVAPGTELAFSDGFNVLLGKNGTGKTTLLKLVAAAVSFDFSKLKDEACAIDYELSFSTGTIEVSIRNDHVERPAPVLPRTEAERRFEEAGFDLALTLQDHGAFSAVLTIRLVEPATEWTVRTDLSSVWLDHSKRKLPLRTFLGARGPGLLLSALQLISNESLDLAYMKELAPCIQVRRFDEALDIFREITSTSTWIEAWIDPSSGTVAGFNYAGLIAPDLFIALESRGKEMSADSQGLSIKSDSLGFLRSACAQFCFSASRLEMRLESKAGGPTREQLTFGDFRFMFEARDGSLIKHEDLSYGQKRLLSFLYYAACNPDIVIADELVNGMHHAWAQACVTEIEGRQSFLASQDPLLFDFLFFASAEEVERSFILCSLEEREGRGCFVWKNLDPESAASFYRAYEAGIQHVSEILRTKGLW